MSPLTIEAADVFYRFPRVSGDEPNTGERSVQWRSVFPA